jgi:hypothetical protein
VQTRSLRAVARRVPCLDCGTHGVARRPSMEISTNVTCLRHSFWPEQHVHEATQPGARGRFLTTLLFGMEHEDIRLGRSLAIRFISSDLADAPSTNTIKSTGRGESHERALSDSSLGPTGPRRFDHRRDGRQAFTATGQFQIDSTPRTAASRPAYTVISQTWMPGTERVGSPLALRRCRAWHRGRLAPINVPFLPAQPFCTNQRW